MIYKKNKRQLIKIGFGIILIINLIFCCCINNGIDSGTDYSYRTIDLIIRYPESNITDKDVLSILENDQNISIIEIDSSVPSSIILSFKLLNSSVTENELNRIQSLLGLPNERRTFELIVDYQTEKPFSEVIHNDKEKSNWEKRVEKQYKIDKEILNEYTFSVTSFLNNSFNINFTDIEYGQKYSFEE